MWTKGITDTNPRKPVRTEWRNLAKLSHFGNMNFVNISD